MNENTYNYIKHLMSEINAKLAVLSATLSNTEKPFVMGLEAQPDRTNASPNAYFYELKVWLLASSIEMRHFDEDEKFDE